MPTVSALVPAFLMLDDGLFLEGTSIGKEGTTTGELCFNTGMTGYQEVFTDPSYTGQVLIANNVHMGNYGVNTTDVESEKITINGLVVRNFTAHNYSRLQAVESLQDYLFKNNTVGISNVDTRMLVAHVRQKGAMNAIISTEYNNAADLKKILDQTPSMNGLELASKVFTQQPYFVGNENAGVKIAVLDFGVKKNILTCLSNKGAYLKVFPGNATVADILAFDAHAFFISNGPGDPSAMPYAIETVKALLQQNKPLFGICLGHQLLALSSGLTTFKMPNGHRGLNHPVKNLLTGKCEITTQNHGFGVNPASVSNNENVEVTHVNLNDQSIEGIRLKNKPAFSVQYHPESTPGTFDSRYLFDDFFNLIATN
jgi:carbamoyl-phosphate synthase small subunit